MILLLRFRSYGEESGLFLESWRGDPRVVSERFLWKIIRRAMHNYIDRFGNAGLVEN